MEYPNNSGRSGFKRIHVGHRFEYALVLVLGSLSRRLPLSAALFFGERLGDVAFSILRLRRRVALENLQAAFPEWSRAQIIDTARRNYRQFGRLVVEYLRLPDLSPHALAHYVEMVHTDVLQDALARGRGAVLVGAHFGNWEYMGAALAASGLPMWYLFQEQANPLVSALITRTRSHMQMRTIPRGAAVRRVLGALRAGDFVAFLADQDAGPDGVFVDFLGRPASFARGPAVFALKTGAPLILCTAIRLRNGRHRAIFETLDVSVDGRVSEENVRAIVTAYARRLEEYVRLYPDHWFWMHRRWKTQPRIESSRQVAEMPG
jgi:KDO2-lipid IV(A) lauroyltransferase